MVGPEEIFVQHQDLKAELLDGEIVLYHDALKKMIYLNESASVVWHLCDGRRSVREIVDLLAEAYPEVAGSIAVDVHGAIDSLVGEGALYVNTTKDPSS